MAREVDEVVLQFTQQGIAQLKRDLGDVAREAAAVEAKADSLRRSLGQLDRTTARPKLQSPDPGPSARQRDARGRFIGAGGGGAGGGGGVVIDDQGFPSPAGGGGGDGGGLLSRMGGIHAVAQGITDVSLRMRQLADSARQAAFEGERADAKLSGMLNKRGEGGQLKQMQEWAGKLAYDAAMVDDDPIKEAAAGMAGFGMKTREMMEIMPGLIGQSRLYGFELSQVAMQMGKAFGRGDVESLQRSGVVFSPADMAKLKEIDKVTDMGARQKLMFEMVRDSLKRYALDASGGLGDAEKAANRFALQMDDVNTKIGQGANRMRQRWQGWATPLMQGLAQSHPGLLSMIGGFAEFGSMAGPVATPIMTLLNGYRMLRDSTNLARLAKGGLTKATNEDIAAEKTKAGVAGEEGKAIKGVGDEAGKTASKMSMLARAKNFLGSQATIGGLGLKQANFMGGGGGAVSNALMLGSLATGAFAGFGARDDYKALGMGEAGADALGTGTGVAAAAASMFIPGAVVPIAMATGIRYMFNELVNVPMERQALEGDTGSKASDAIAGQQAQGSSDAQLAQSYEAKANQVQAEADRVNPYWDWRGQVAWDEKAGNEAEAKSSRIMAAMLRKRNRSGVPTTQANVNRQDNGSTTIQFAPITLPQSQGDAMSNDAAYNDSTASPNYDE